MNEKQLNVNPGNENLRNVNPGNENPRNVNPGNEDPSGEKKENIKKEILSWVWTFAIALAIALFLNHVILISAVVPSGSMENTIQKGDRLIGLRTSYWNADPERGDIVIFQFPVDEAKGVDTKYIKRVIGLPGETVEIRDAKIYINGSEEPLDEPYLKEEWTIQNDGMIFEVPKGCYLMLGDNRNNSGDSRYWAAQALGEGVVDTAEEAQELSYVRRDKILAKATFRYWPITQFKVFQSPW